MTTDHGHFGYQILRRQARQLLSLVRDVIARNGNEVVAQIDPQYATLLSLMQYELDARCARCGEEHLEGLEGYIRFRTRAYAGVCASCFSKLSNEEPSDPARVAQLGAIARYRPGLVAGAFVATLDRRDIEWYEFETRLGVDELTVARLALSPLPRPEHFDEDAAALASWSRCNLDALVELLGPPPVPRIPPDELETRDNSEDVPF
ncbi:MAG: hypothetical protein RLZZ387_3417 [Chloroflexota bacterium]|jgi:hypothetical protein